MLSPNCITFHYTYTYNSAVIDDDADDGVSTVGVVGPLP